MQERAQPTHIHFQRGHFRTVGLHQGRYELLGMVHEFREHNQSIEAGRRPQYVYGECVMFGITARFPGHDCGKQNPFQEGV